FFSSRRRHTRFSRDWSSDVCSSDLVLQRDRRRARAALVEVGAKLRDETSVAYLDGELEVQPEASGVEVPRADDGPHIVDDEQLQIGRASCRESVARPVGGGAGTAMW